MNYMQPVIYITIVVITTGRVQSLHPLVLTGSIPGVSNQASPDVQASTCMFAS